MSKEVINVGGEDRVVREDTAKSYRGTVWALLSVLGFIIVLAVLFIVFFGKSLTDNRPNESPSQIENRRQ